MSAGGEKYVYIVKVTIRCAIVVSLFRPLSLPLKGLSQLVLDLLPSDLGKSLDRYSTLKAFRLPVALAEVHRVQVMLIVEAGLDELLHAKNSRWIQTLQL